MAENVSLASSSRDAVATEINHILTELTCIVKGVVLRGAGAPGVSPECNPEDDRQDDGDEEERSETDQLPLPAGDVNVGGSRRRLGRDFRVLDVAICILGHHFSRRMLLRCVDADMFDVRIQWEIILCYVLILHIRTLQSWGVGGWEIFLVYRVNLIIDSPA